MLVGRKAIREAAGQLINDSSIDICPVTIAQSLNELDQTLQQLIETAESKIECDWGMVARRDQAGNVGLTGKPIFAGKKRLADAVQE